MRQPPAAPHPSLAPQIRDEQRARHVVAVERRLAERAAALEDYFGVAYDLFGTGRTALKASIGRYVGKMGPSVATANVVGGMISMPSRSPRGPVNVGMPARPRPHVGRPGRSVAAVP